jgi:hypothetical protein
MLADSGMSFEARTPGARPAMTDQPKSSLPPTVPAFPDSLCHTCAAHRYVADRARTFVMCTALAEKYPAAAGHRVRGFSERRARRTQLVTAVNQVHASPWMPG